MKSSFVVFVLDGGAYRGAKSYVRRCNAISAGERSGRPFAVREYRTFGDACGSRWLVPPPVSAPLWLQGARGEHMSAGNMV